MPFPFEYKKLNLGWEISVPASSVTFLHIGSRRTLLESWEACISLCSGRLYQEGAHTAGRECAIELVTLRCQFVWPSYLSVFWTFLKKCHKKREAFSNAAHIFFVIIYGVLCIQCNPSANFNFLSYSLCLNSAFLILNIYGSLWEEYIKMADGGRWKHVLDWRQGTLLWIYSQLSKKVHSVWW